MVITKERVKEVAKIAKEFVQPYENQPWWNSYKLEDVSFYDPNAQEKDLCIVLRVLTDWQGEVNIPKEYKGVRIFTERRSMAKKAVSFEHAHEAIKNFSLEYFDPEYICGIGVGACNKDTPDDKDHYILVHLKKILPNSVKLPTEYQGVKVYIEVVGEIEPQS